MRKLWLVACESFRWWFKIDWELVDMRLTGEARWFPPRDSPYFIETWRCKRTGERREHFVF